MVPFANAVVSTSRAGVAVLVNQRVQVDWPSRTTIEGMEGKGQLVGLRLFDRPASVATYAAGDRLDVLALDGHDLPPAPTRYMVSQVSESAPPLSLVSCQLSGFLFVPNSTIEIRRNVYNSTTKQSTRASMATGVACYIDDRSTELALAGLAPAYTVLVVCDGAVDLRDGDQLVGYNPGTSLQAPVVQVQHVAHHQMAGWDYKSALAKAETP